MKANVLKKDNILELPTKSKPRIICSKEDWQRMDREEAIQKECQERKNKPIGKGSKYIWIGMNFAEKISDNFFTVTIFKRKNND